MFSKKKNSLSLKLLYMQQNCNYFELVYKNIVLNYAHCYMKVNKEYCKTQSHQNGFAGSRKPLMTIAESAVWTAATGNIGHLLQTNC